MTSSKPTKVGSFQKRKMVEKNKTVSTHKPPNLNFWKMRIGQRSCKFSRYSLVENGIAMVRLPSATKSTQDFPKSLMCGSFNVQPTKENNYHLVIGDNYEKRICTLQSNEVRFRCKDSNSEDWFSLQVQYQLPYYMDSEVSAKSLNWKGGICA